MAWTATVGAFLSTYPLGAPQNAIVYGSGAVPITRMVRTGFTLDIIGAILIISILPVMVGITGIGR